MLMQKLRPLLHTIDAISDWVGKVASFIILLLIGVVIWNVVMRYLYFPAILWIDELATCGKLSFTLVVLGAAYALRTKSHINVDILYNRFPLRARGIIDLVTSTLFFLLCIVLLWKVVEVGLSLHLSLRLFLPPYWPTNMIMFVGVSLLLLQGLAKFIRDLIIAITGREAA